MDTGPISMQEQMTATDKAAMDDKISKVARKIIFASRTSLIVHLRFLDAAINRLPLVEYDGYICVDGKAIRYNPRFVISCYSGNKNLVTRMYLHMVLHCLFTHFFVGPGIVQPLWNLACDIAVENILDELAQSEDYLTVEKDPARDAELAGLIEGAGAATAEKIYRYLLDNAPDDERLDYLTGLFIADDHEIWYKNKEKELTPPKDSPQEQDENEGEGEGEGEGNDEDAPPQPDDETRSEEKQQKDDSENKEEEEVQPPEDAQQDAQEWQEVTRHMQLDLETFSKRMGESVGNLLINAKAATRERYDYTSFLKKFAAVGEKMVVNDDEFDYIYYTYGLRMYNNMPLVEPLEYKEMRVVRDFVIAIDTSFSVHGDEVQSFIRKTYNLLKASESFAAKINLHIIQCDVKVQHDEKITTQAELDAYMKDMLLYGFGGTDFRPVFEYVEQLIAEKEFTNLKGLIYFTDGFGTFPERPPSYRTAFAFVSDDPAFDPVVPPWAIKLILDPEDIKDDDEKTPKRKRGNP